MRIRRLSNHHNPRFRDALALTLAMLCVFAVVRLAPTDGVVFHGKDSDTVTGLRSTTESFARAGTYTLHDYSMTPMCSLCQQIPVQVDHGIQIQVRGLELFNRAIPTDLIVTSAEVEAFVAPFQSPLNLAGLLRAPESPPPRS